MAVVEKGTVLVTGAGGFVASWLVKILLSNGYRVNGTLRQPDDDKHSHLHKLISESDQNLKLFKADMLNYDSVLSAVHGCVGAFHVASPVPSTTSLNPEAEVLEPAVIGTQNVLNACLEAKIKRLVYVSSGAAVALNPNWPTTLSMDETCWSDQHFCRETKNWYCLSKTQAESEALQFSKQTGLDVVSVCPTLILGPVLQSNLNASTLVLLNLLKEGYETLENKLRSIVDVRDVVGALLMAYEKPEADSRYICTAHSVGNRVLVDKLKTLYPHFNYPKNITNAASHETTLSNEKLMKLGWTYRPLEETLIDSVESYRASGLLEAN